MARSSNADTDSETRNQYSRDYDDLNRLKDIPNFWDLFSEYPEFTGSSDDTNSQGYPQQYALPPSSSAQGNNKNIYKNLLLELNQYLIYVKFLLVNFYVLIECTSFHNNSRD